MLKLIQNLTSGRRFYAAAALLLLLFTGMRAVHINADAPQDLTTSAATFTDEGFKTYDPRNIVLYGDIKWTPEDEYQGWAAQSPLATIPYIWIFQHWGVSYATIRLLSVAYAALTMVLLLLFLSRNYDRYTGLVGLILFGTNYFTAMYNRLGLFEAHLIFYIMLSLFGFAEAFRRPPPGEGKRHLRRALFFLVALAGVAGGFFIKRNLLVIAPALIPALAVYLCGRSKKYARHMNTAFVLILVTIVVFYGVLGHLKFLRTVLAFSLMSYQVFGQPLVAFLPFTAFDPLHMVLAKGMYLEFVFLQPLTFFAGFIYALYTFYGYMFKERRNHGDLFLSSWLMFGFLFLTIMYYSPSRYYLLFNIPLIVLAARFITGTVSPEIAAYITEKKKSPHGLMLAIFLVFGALYTGVVVAVMLVPVSLRTMIVDKLYPYYLAHDYKILVAMGVAAVLALLACSLFAVLKRRRLLKLLGDPRFGVLLFTLILTLQLFQYGKWFFFHDHSLYEASQEVGRTLPPNAILAGSWSSGLVVENRIKPLVVQSLIPYNHNLIKKLTYDVPIQINSIRDGKKVTEYRSDIPLYIAICQNVIFEKAITDLYREHFTKENLVKTFTFGYFKVELFKMNKYRLKEEDEVKVLFNRLL
jgi:hypothetical protein